MKTKRIVTIIISSIVIIVLLMSKANDHRNGVAIDMSDIMDRERDYEIHRAESLTEYERLDQYYRQAHYELDYPGLEERLYEEMKAELDAYYSEVMLDSYMYYFELEMTPEGLYNAYFKDLSIREILDNNPEYVKCLTINLSAFIDTEKYKLKTYSELRKRFRDMVSYEEWNRFKEVFPIEIMKTYEIWDYSILDNLDYKFGYNEAHLKFMAKIYNEYDQFKEDRHRYSDIERLESKYNEKFMRVYPKDFIGLDGEFASGLMFAPISNPEIIFDVKYQDDMYVPALYQHYYAEHIDAILEKYNATDKIGYFLADNSMTVNNKDTSQMHDESILMRNDLKTIITFYYLLNKGEEEDQELIRNIILDLNCGLGEGYVFTQVFLYELNDNDKKIAIKLLNEAKKSEIYVSRDSGMSTWSENMYKKRNDADAFSFLECFGTKKDYLYKFTEQNDPFENMNDEKTTEEF